MKYFRLNVLLPLGITVALVIILLAFLQKGQAVDVEEATRGLAIDAVPATVEVGHAFIVTLSGEEGGRIIESQLKLGERVEKGDWLVKVDDTDLQLEAEALRDRIEHLEQRAELHMQQEIDLAQAKEELANHERQYEAGNYPELEITRRRREFKAFQENQLRENLDQNQQLDDLRNQLKRIELRIERCTIHAPSAGTVNQLFSFTGEIIHPRSPIAHIHSDKLLVTARVNEEDFAGVKQGLQATVRLLTYGGQLFPAKVSHVLPGADPETQQYSLFLDLEIPEGLMLPGLSGEASIIRSRKENALLIPRMALFGNSVFVAKNGQAVQRSVKTGARGLNKVEILEGLETGEFVITSGASELNEGDRIRIR